VKLRSSVVTDGPERAPARAMLRAVGFGDSDFGKPVVGVASAYSTITPCNLGLAGLAARAEAALRVTPIAVKNSSRASRKGRVTSTLVVTYDQVARSVSRFCVICTIDDLHVHAFEQ
jgi:dihydroxyacid dehydratase/phosphogluconate dehydratase